MPDIDEFTKNEKSLTNASMTDITWDEATMTWDEAQRSWDALGKPITKASKNEKSLTNASENV